MCKRIAVPDASVSGPSVANPGSFKYHSAQPFLMLKTMMLGLVLAAVALSGIMFVAISVTSAETVPSPLQQMRDGIPIGKVVCFEDRVLMASQSGMPACVFEESVLELNTRGFELVGDLPPGTCLTSPAASISGEPLLGPLPKVCISNLPAINETAIVTVTYTHDSRLDVTETETQSYPRDYSTGWRVSLGFEIVDSGNMTAKPFYPPGWNEPTDYEYSTPTPLNTWESVTYTFEVRAVEEGNNYVAGVGYYGVDAHIFMYLDDEETMFSSEHRALYPEMHQSPPKMSKNEMAQAEDAEHLRQLAEAIKNPPPNIGRSLEEGEIIEVAIMWVVKEGFTPEEAVEHLARHASLNVDELRRILTGADFSEDEINIVLPTSGTYTAYPDGCVHMTSPSGASICVLEGSVPKMEVLGFELAG